MQFIDMQTPQQHLLLQHHTLKSRTEIGPVLGQAFGQVWAYAQEHGIVPAGPPIARWLRFDENGIEVEAGFPIAAAASVSAGSPVYYLHLPTMQTLRVDYMGHYDGMAAAYEVIMANFAAKGIQMAGPCWEQYVTDPGAEPDPTKWLTQIYLPYA